MAHACNPTYSGSRDQKDHGSKPCVPLVIGTEFPFGGGVGLGSYPDVGG
jgi:hypothetical protein